MLNLKMINELNLGGYQKKELNQFGGVWLLLLPFSIFSST